MKFSARSLFLTTACVVGLGTFVGSVAVGQPEKSVRSAQPTSPSQPGQPPMKLPPGWTEADMQACMTAGMPGKNHEKLAAQIGVWDGKCQMWMGPGGEVMNSDCTSTVTAAMGGNYIKTEMAGDMPGMGPYNGFGITGYDNVSQKFVGTWIDNHSTGIMNGTGELSKDGKTMTWTYTFNCPITKKPAVIRQIETYVDSKTMTLEMFMTDPKSGKEYKGMHIDLTKKS